MFLILSTYYVYSLPCSHFIYQEIGLQKINDWLTVMSSNCIWLYSSCLLCFAKSKLNKCTRVNVSESELQRSFAYKNWASETGLVCVICFEAAWQVVGFSFLFLLKNNGTENSCRKAWQPFNSYLNLGQFQIRTLDAVPRTEGQTGWILHLSRGGHWRGTWEWEALGG